MKNNSRRGRPRIPVADAPRNPYGMVRVSLNPETEMVIPVDVETRALAQRLMLREWPGVERVEELFAFAVQALAERNTTMSTAEFASHIMDHPEIGAVLDSQCGAQSDGCAYDTPERSEAAAPVWLRGVLLDNRRLWSVGCPGYIRAVLAADGWWWKVG